MTISYRGSALLLLTVGLAVALDSPLLNAQSPATGSITAVGCINRAVQDGSLAGAPGVPPATPANAPNLANANEPTGAFLLNGASRPGDREAVGTTGSSAPKTPITYVLEGTTSELESHLGHQVEVSGTLQKMAEGAPEAKTIVGHIRVSTIKMLAPECAKPAPQ